MLRVSPEDEEDAWVQFVKHEDKGYSFTDFTSFALMHGLGISLALSTDQHFHRVGFQVEP